MKKRIISIILVLSMITAMLPVGGILTSASPANGLQTSGGTTSYNKNGEEVIIDSNLTIESISENISGANVMIRDVQDGDRLHFSNAYGITGTYSSVTGILSLSGTTTPANYQAALRSVAFSTTSNKENRTIDFVLGSSLYFEGHFYEYINHGSRITWTDAKNAAERRSFFGREGYLVTITNAEENEFVRSKTEALGWIGAQDINHPNGDWRWVTGPEGTEDNGKGLKFWSGYDNSANRGRLPNSAYNNSYSNWATGEPNNWNGIEDVAHIFGKGNNHGKWNDYAKDNTSVTSYIVEYGGMPNDIPISIQASKEIIITTIYTPSLSISITPTSAEHPADVTLTATLTGADRLSGKLIKFYNGDTLLGWANTDASGEATYTVNSPSAATYNYRAVFDKDENNESVSSSVSSFTVSKGTQSEVTFDDTNDIEKTYGDSSFTLPAVSGGSGTGNYNYRSSNSDTVTVSGNEVTITGAGEAIVYVKRLGDNNFNDSDEASVKIIVSQKPVTITGISASYKEYDGEDTATIINDSASISGVINGDAVSIDGSNATATFSNADAGTAKVVIFEGFALSGNHAGNYTLTAQPASTTANITPRKVTVSGITGLDKTYDGNKTATLDFTEIIFDRLLENDSLSITATGTYTSKNVQSDAIQIDLSGFQLSGTSVENYELATTGQQTTTSAKITPATITVTPESGQSKFYGQSDPPLTYSAKGAVGTETPAFTGNLARDPGESIANDYTIKLGTLKLDNNEPLIASNYQLEFDSQKDFEIKEYTTTAVATATPDGENDWFTTTPILSAPDGYHISISNTVTDNTWADTITLDDNDGIEKSATYYLRRNTGNDSEAISTSKTFNYKVDLTDPADLKATYGSSTLFKFLNTVTFGLFFNETTTVTLEATDATSGVNHFDVSFNGTPSKESIRVNKSGESFTFNIAPQFVGNFTVTATDMSGNVSDSISFEYMAVDNAAPTTPRVSATSNNGSHTTGTWSASDILATVSSSKADSGIAKYQYSNDNGVNWFDMNTTDKTDATYSTPYNAIEASLTVSDNQNETYQFRAISNSGLQSSVQDFAIKLDTMTPQISVVPYKSGDWTNENVTFTLGNDTAQLSGTSYQVSKGSNDYVDITTLGEAWDASSSTLTISTDTDTTYQFKAISGAGLSNESVVYDVKVDKTVPVISTPTGMPENWIREQQIMTFTVSENGSGIASVTVKNGETEITSIEGDTVNDITTYTFETTGNGNYTIDAVDNASNTAERKTISISKIDTDLPVIESVTGNATAWQNTDVTLTVTASDSGSGLAEAAYSFDGGATWQTEDTKVYNENQTIEAETIRIRDTAGNIQSYSSEIIITKIDKTNPEDPSIRLNGNDPDTGWYKEYPVIEITPADHIEGTSPETTYYKLWNTSAEVDNSEPNSGTKLIAQPTIDHDGVWKLKTWTSDEVGNTSTPVTITIQVDRRAPDGDIKINENSVKTFINTITFGLFFNKNVDITISASDSTSDVAKVEYYKSTDILDEQEVQDITSWVKYKYKITETAVDSARFIYYVRITDHANNVTYFASNGAIFDTIKPVIEGITTGAVYYVDQVVTVTDVNPDTVTLNGDAFKSGQKITGNIDKTYNFEATDKAGNRTTVTVTMKPIQNLAAAIDSLSVNNVVSSDKMAIEAVRSNVKSLLPTTDNGASQAQIDKLHSIIAKCNALLTKIQETGDKMSEVYTKTNGLTIDNVKSSDKGELESALSIVKNLLGTNNLTASEKLAMEQKKIDIENSLDRILEVENAVIKACDPVKDITEGNVRKIDKPALEQAMDDLQKILDKRTSNLTDAEIQEIKDQMNSITTIIKVLDEVAKVEVLIDNLPNSNAVSKADADAIFKAYDAYERLTGHQKELVNSTFKLKLDKVIEALKKELLYDAPTQTRVEGINGTVFDLRTKLVVRSVMDTLDLAIMQKFALSVEGVAEGQEIVDLYDIKLMLEGQSIQPEGMIKITLTLTDEQANFTNLQIVHIAEDGTITIIPSTVSGKTISFIIDHLSYYGIIGTPAKDPVPKEKDLVDIPRTGEVDTGRFLLLGLLSIALGGAVLKKKASENRRKS
ncbi:YDG domain-containing protein [Alkalibacter saccharofermentans]|uniref:Ig-like domain (Group 3) n=1 Tax=Alkalibacter saccharofermentans DSM 14828 TaxID=1120975 RepID=A0A1M4ZYI6_9FIRM|nr:YDG domain-containing protein [Alkalibacter saccharofermentans]SHF23120.1 Ig-like domain (group 3) [Alkalibacter saccharofermentans DSM 14828]